MLQYHVLEEVQPRASVGNVALDYGLDKKYPPSVFNSLRFSFLTHPAKNKQYFSVDDVSGVLRTTQRIDRESICPQQSTCFIKFDVAVQPIKYFQIIRVRVEIMDINDNSPYFLQDRLTFQISESADPGTSFLIPPANDMDSHKNGVVQYEIDPPTDCFELIGRNPPNGTAQLRLSLRERLDRETDDLYRFYILAIDGGDPVLTGSIQIYIEVLDSNDNTPAFENSSYEVSLNEDTQAGSVILRVKAMDPDLGPNGLVSYNLSRETLAEFGQTFAIMHDSGKIYTKSGLDYETRSVYLLYVTASDQAAIDPLSTQAIIVVSVVDVNDNVPTMRVNQRRQPEVVEGSEIGTFVAHVTVEDLDSGDNGKFHCAIVGGNGLFDLKQLYPTEFKVVTMAKFDREARDAYEIGITCRDSGTPSLSSTIPVKVKVIDRNDHAPVFLREFFHASFEENNAIGFLIIRVTASDEDAGSNGAVTYSIDSDAARFVNIDRMFGFVTSAVSFDRENVSFYDFEVTATDMGVPKKSSKTRLKLTVLDADDEHPEFILPEYTFVVEENQPSGLQVGTVKAIDRDLPPNNRIVYLINSQVTSESGYPFPFQVDERTGSLTTTGSLDFETQSSYEMELLAISSMAGSSYTASTSVTVYVADVNDHKPILEFPKADDNLITISSHAPSGHVVVQLKARDLDSSLNSKLLYRITNGNEAELFDVESETGVVRVRADLSSVQDKDISLDVTVVDVGDPTFFDTGVLRIAVRDDPAAGPSISSEFYRLLASEGLAIVLTVTLFAIFVAIAIVISILCLVRKYRRSRQEKDKFQRKQAMMSEEKFSPDGQLIYSGPHDLCKEKIEELTRVSSNKIRNKARLLLTVACSNNNNVSLKDTRSKPVVAFVKDSIMNDTLVSRLVNSDSDSGRGQSSEDGASFATAAAAAGAVVAANPTSSHESSQQAKLAGRRTTISDYKKSKELNIEWPPTALADSDRPAEGRGHAQSPIGGRVGQTQSDLAREIHHGGTAVEMEAAYKTDKGRADDRKVVSRPMRCSRVDTVVQLQSPSRTAVKVHSGHEIDPLMISTNQNPPTSLSTNHILPNINDAMQTCTKTLPRKTLYGLPYDFQGSSVGRPDLVCILKRDYETLGSHLLRSRQQTARTISLAEEYLGGGSAKSSPRRKKCLQQFQDNRSVVYGVQQFELKEFRNLKGVLDLRGVRDPSTATGEDFENGRRLQFTASLQDIENANDWPNFVITERKCSASAAHDNIETETCRIGEKRKISPDEFYPPCPSNDLLDSVV